VVPCFEIFQKVNDIPLKKCLKCGNPVKKILSPPALRFKGKGWYVTDYAKNTKPEKEKKGEEKSKDLEDKSPEKSRHSTPTK